MGRNKKPSLQKELNGSSFINPGRVNKDEPKPKKKLSKAPKNLSKEEKEAWKDIATRIIDGVAFDSDHVHIEIAAKLLAKIRNPAVDSSGNEVLVVSAYAQLGSLLAKLGMNPSDRQRIRVEPDQDKKDPWSNFETKH